MFTPLFPSFLLTALLIELTPGPNMAWLALTSASEGRRAGWAATAGIAVGLAVVGLAAALGLAELAQSSPALFAILRYAGVAYLLWLAWQGWSGAAEVSPGHTHNGDSPKIWFRHGLTINLLNPKAALFFVAILPTFVVPDRPAMPQTLMLSASFVAIATLVHLLLVQLAGFAHDWLQRGTHARLVRRYFAAMLAAIASWFLWDTAL